MLTSTSITKLRHSRNLICKGRVDTEIIPRHYVLVASDPARNNQVQQLLSKCWTVSLPLFRIQSLLTLFQFLTNSWARLLRSPCVLHTSPGCNRPFSLHDGLDLCSKRLLQAQTTELNCKSYSAFHTGHYCMLSDVSIVLHQMHAECTLHIMHNIDSAASSLYNCCCNSMPARLLVIRCWLQMPAAGASHCASGLQQPGAPPIKSRHSSFWSAFQVLADSTHICR